jgi:hypothetical protein
MLARARAVCSSMELVLSTLRHLYLLLLRRRPVGAEFRAETRQQISLDARLGQAVLCTELPELRHGEIAELGRRRPLQETSQRYSAGMHARVRARVRMRTDQRACRWMRQCSCECHSACTSLCALPPPPPSASVQHEPPSPPPPAERHLPSLLQPPSLTPSLPSWPLSWRSERDRTHRLRTRGARAARSATFSGDRGIGWDRRGDLGLRLGGRRGFARLVRPRLRMPTLTLECARHLTS